MTGLLLTASLALAGKPVPPPPSIIATTTDENVLYIVVGQVSSQTLFDLAISASGTGTHYRYKNGPAATTNRNDVSGYSAPVLEGTRLVADISNQPDGDFVLCLQGLQIDKKGKI